MISLSLVSFAQHIQRIIDKCSGMTNNPIPQDVYSAWYKKKCSHYKFSEKKFVFLHHRICSMITNL